MNLTEELSQAAKTKFVRLSQSETHELIAQAKRGGAAGKQAVTTLVKRNIRLILKAAGRYRFAAGPTAEGEDLVQFAFIAFLNAIHHFNPKAGVRFTTYATLAMRRACSRGLSNDGQAMRLPVHQQRRLRKIRAVVEAQPGPRKTDYAQLAVATGFSPRQIKRTLDLPVVTCSFDDLDYSGKNTLADRIPAPEPDEPLADPSRAELMGFLKSTMDPTHLMAICLRYGLDAETPEGLSVDEISRRMGFSRSKVACMIKRAEDQLRAPLFADRLKSLLQQA